MKKFLSSACILILFSTSQVFAMTAREIVEKSDNLPRSKATGSSVVMVIHSQETAIEKAFTMKSIEPVKNETKTLVSFTRPSRIKLLTHTHPDKDDDQWLMMSSGKIKRITASSKGKSFVNSHFSYEDLSSRKIDDYTYQSLSDETVLDEPCYKIEALKTKGSKVYDKIILSIRKSDFFVLQVDFFKKEKQLKRLEMHDVKTVDGILTAYDMRMIEEDGSEWTELKLESVEYNKELNPSMFNKDALR